MAGIAFAIVPGIVAEKEKRSADRKDSIENLKKEMVVDENASKLALAAVFREISGHREAIDEAQGTFKETKEKVDFLESELAKVAEELKEAEAESEELVPSRLDAQSKLAEVNARLEPLKANANGISATRQGLEEELGGVQKDNQDLQTKLDKLIFAREQILVDFREREKFYRDFLFADQLYEHCLPMLSDRLNKIHNVTHSTRYWRFIVGPWLFTLIGIL